jgi:prepilin-type N-terminal cleavage/methylation domain-containing protein
MLSKLKKSNNKGFTIIEVMIVLAIAGLILLIVFLAVPALQRSSRNTQRKSDVGRVGSAATTVLSNNNNDVTKLTTANLQNEVGNMSYYTSSEVAVSTTTAPATPAVTNDQDTSHVLVWVGAVCAAVAGGTNGGVTYGAGQGATKTGAQNTSIAITYSTETGSNPAPNCATE